MRAALSKAAAQHSTHSTSASALTPDTNSVSSAGLEPPQSVQSTWPLAPESSTPDWPAPLRLAGLGRWRRCMIGHPGRYVLRPKGAAALVARAASKDTRSGSVAPPHPPLLLHPRCRCQLSTIRPRRPINPKAFLVRRRRHLRPLSSLLSFSFPQQLFSPPFIPLFARPPACSRRPPPAIQSPPVRSCSNFFPRPRRETFHAL